MCFQDASLISALTNRAHSPVAYQWWHRDSIQTVKRWCFQQNVSLSPVRRLSRTKPAQLKVFDFTEVATGIRSRSADKLCADSAIQVCFIDKLSTFAVLNSKIYPVSSDTKGVCTQCFNTTPSSSTSRLVASTHLTRS